MRLPLWVITGRSAESLAADPQFAGCRIILNQAQATGLAVGLENCFCCTGQSALRDTLNSIYIDWAHDRTGIKGAVIVPDEGADLDDLFDFLNDDLMTRARWVLKPAP